MFLQLSQPSSLNVVRNENCFWLWTVVLVGLSRFCFGFESNAWRFHLTRNKISSPEIASEVTSSFFFFCSIIEEETFANSEVLLGTFCQKVCFKGFTKQVIRLKYYTHDEIPFESVHTRKMHTFLRARVAAECSALVPKINLQNRDRKMRYFRSIKF